MPWAPRRSRVHASVGSLAGGLLAGFVAAIVCIWWTLRGLARVTERSLLAGDLTVESLDRRPPGARTPRVGDGRCRSGAWGCGLLAGGAAGASIEAGAFFGAGALLLGASAVARGARAAAVRPGARWPDADGAAWAAWACATCRTGPGRAVLSVAVVAAAAFILVTVGAFRRGPTRCVERARVGHRRLHRAGRVVAADRARPGHR